MKLWESSHFSVRQSAGEGAALPAAPSFSRDRISGTEAALLVQTYEDSEQGWFWSTDAHGRVRYLSAQARDILTTAEIQPDQARFTDLLTPADDEIAQGRTLRFLLTSQKKFERVTLRSAHDEMHWWSVSGYPQFARDGSFAGYRGTAIDITELRQSSQTASKLAMFDTLTGLPNRLRMAHVLQTSLTALEHQKRPCAVMLIDLDRFKQVNDTLGHPAGDALLKQVADRLSRIVNRADSVFRLGGDEFQLIVRDCDNRDTLGELADRIINSLSQPFLIEGSRCVIGASIGIVTSPVDGRTSEELIRKADLALYEAKGVGRGCYKFFSDNLLEAAQERRQLEDELRDAITCGQLSLAYQPIVCAVSGVITGVETLLRWTHPVRGPISPALFIPIAEETNLIQPIGEWVLRKACEEVAKWPGNVRVAVNVSTLQFASENFPALVASALAASELPPARLELEITESVFLGDQSEATERFTDLKALGVRFALDDFGTGYSSLSYLRTAPFDKIKIDQSFVRAATLPESRNRAIIAAIVALAQALDMETTAEGIETLDQLDLMRDLRVSHIQGYVYGKPAPAAEIARQLEAGEWTLTPAGPAKQRSRRVSMYRKAGAIFGNFYHNILIKNLSKSGALFEAAFDLAVDSPLVVDFGEGQLAFARVRRRAQRLYGVEFQDSLIEDENGTLMTSERIAPYLLRRYGLPTAGQAPAAGAALPQAPALFEQLGGRGGGATGGEPQKVSGKPGVGTSGSTGQAAGGSSTIASLAKRYAEQLREDPRHTPDLRLLHDHIIPKFGSMTADALRPNALSHWLNEGVRTARFGVQAAQQMQVLISQLYLLAIQDGCNVAGTDGSGGEGGGPVALLGRRDASARALNDEELKRLNEAVQASTNAQLKAVVALLIGTGARLREILRAEWVDVDLAEGRWAVRASATATARTISLSDDVIALLRGLPRWPNCALIVVNPKTLKPYRSFEGSWSTVRQRAGLHDLELDDLRHSVSSFARRKSVPDAVLDHFTHRRAAG